MPHDDYMITIRFNHHPKMLSIKLSRFWELRARFVGSQAAFPAAFRAAFVTEMRTHKDTGIKVDESMAWAWDRHLTDILARRG